MPETRKPSFELIALIVVLAAGAVLARWWSTRSDTVVLPPPAPVAGGRQAPPFALSDVDGAVVQYQPGAPHLIILTAIGCQECRARVPVDQQAVDEAHRRAIPVWNLLVFANRDSGKAFFDQVHPSEDKVLVDPGGTVSVQQLGGSDATCWIAINGAGTICWQGPGTVDNIPLALDAITARR